ncbi:MAG: ASPIC/UnbV domain-containing protein, partial [Thermoanaerobaculia bacterium]
DNDGDLDVLMLNNNGPARLLLNRVGNRSRWLGLRLGERRGGPSLGAAAAVRRTDGANLERRIQTDGSYCSAGDPRALAGLGPEGTGERLEARWPTRERQRWYGPPSNRYLALGRPAASGGTKR